jgi:anti-sigma B factor antagonist
VERFHVETIDGPDHITVRIAGDVDMAKAETLAQAFGPALSVGRRVVVDCSQITFLDSTGLQVLAEARVVARKSRIGFQLSSASEPVLRVLELSGTTTLFDRVAAGPVEYQAPDLLAEL